MTGLYVFIVVAVIALAIMLPILIKKTKKAQADTNKMETAGPVIERLSELAKSKMRQAGFSENFEDYSTAGYEYFEYKTKYHYEDNLHLIIDKASKQIAHYQLIPFHFDVSKQYTDLEFFRVYSFKDLVKVELNTNLGNISTTTIGTGVGTSFGGVGVGVAASTGTSTQMVNSLMVDLYFKDGTTASCNFLNNMSIAMGSEYYVSAVSEARVLVNICELIIKDNEPKNESTNVVSKLQDLKKLLDSGVITQEEFEAQKKKLL